MIRQNVHHIFNLFLIYWTYIKNRPMENHSKFMEIYELFLIYWTFVESYTPNAKMAARLIFFCLN